MQIISPSAFVCLKKSLFFSLFLTYIFMGHRIRDWKFRGLNERCGPTVLSLPARNLLSCLSLLLCTKTFFSLQNPGLSESSSQLDCDLGTSCLSLHCPVSAKILLSQFSQNPLDTRRWPLITVACPQQEPRQVGLARNHPLPADSWSFLSVVFCLLTHPQHCSMAINLNFSMLCS